MLGVDLRGVAHESREFFERYVNGGDGGMLGE